jgi:hypothetical protein
MSGQPQILRPDAFYGMPSAILVLLTILAVLGVVAHAAAL